MSTSVDLTKANSLLDHLKTILESKGTVNITAANHTLTQLKIELTRFPTQLYISRCKIFNSSIISCTYYI